MIPIPDKKNEPSDSLQAAIQKESQKFKEYYLWLKAHMPPSFFEEVEEENIMLVVHSLMGFDIQDFFSHIHLKHAAITLCLDSPDADLRILNHYRMLGIKNYRAFVSNAPPPFAGVKPLLRIATIQFTEFVQVEQKLEDKLPPVRQKEIFQQLKMRCPEIDESEFQHLLKSLPMSFIRLLTHERLILALHMFFLAKRQDTCQYEVRYNEEWKEKKEIPSMQLVLAWRNVPKHNFLYRLAKTVHRHNLTMKRLGATYVDPYSKDNILILSLGLHGSHGKAAWEEADIADFLQEVATLKYFDRQEAIETIFVDSGLLSGNLGNLVRTMVHFVHQVLVQADVNMYAFNIIEEGLCRHPELTVQLAQAFEFKFHPDKGDLRKYQACKEKFLKLVDDLDTGQELNDIRRKNILKQALNFIDFTLKTNFYCSSKTAFSFRLDPQYLEHVPYDRKEKFPELPFAIFFMKGMHYTGFHIRFKDLSRGGLRTIVPTKMEQMLAWRNNVFAECYGLAYTQQKKNKDIPEGGAKGVIFLEPYERLATEEEIYKHELEEAILEPSKIEEKITRFHQEHSLEYLYQTQRSYIECFMTLINCKTDGTLKAERIVDYFKKPEYIYLGPDENLHNAMIIWIADYSKAVGYKPGGSFISSKPGAGINHKEYGVTSLGVNVYMEEVLKYLGIDPYKERFTLKMSGGPDGDVAGNQILNLHRFYPKTAKLLALTDVSGTIFDPEGLDLEILAQFFKDAKSVRFYPPQKLSPGGFLLDLSTKREQTSYAQQTLCWRNEKGKLIEDWLSGNEMNHLFRNNVHKTKSDIFIPAGGRPRTLNDHNYQDFTDETGKPTSQAIVEGANLYLTPWARRSLEKMGVLIIKDSSANKGGVICSSFEVLAGLTLTEEEFIKEKPAMMQEILQIIQERAKDEAQLLLNTHAITGNFLTDISETISERINSYTYQLMDYLEPLTLSDDPEDPLIRCLLNYCLPLLRMHYQKRILEQIPPIHKKAIIACYLGSRLVYKRGLDWSPKLIDVLPLIVQDPAIIGPF